MTLQCWQPLPPLLTQMNAVAPALWVCVIEFLRPPFKIRITATGQWEWAPGRACTADGDASERLPADTLVASAPLGALIGKIGGSTCDKGDWLPSGGAVPASGLTRPAVFAIGSSAIIVSGADAASSLSGPLYVAMNDSPLRLQYHRNSAQNPLKIAIEEAVG